jgi:hypothetical protein
MPGRMSINLCPGLTMRQISTFFYKEALRYFLFKTIATLHCKESRRTFRCLVKKYLPDVEGIYQHSRNPCVFQCIRLIQQSPPLLLLALFENVLQYVP